VALCPPQIPLEPVHKLTWVSVVTGPGLTVRVIYLRWEKLLKNAFCCIGQSRCVLLPAACATNMEGLLFEGLCNRNCHTAVLSEVGYICQISHIQYLDYFL